MKYLYPLVICVSALASPATARENLGVFGNWGAFKERGACYAIAVPTQSEAGKRSEPYITVSQFLPAGSAPQIMVATGASSRTVSVRAGGQNFRPTVRNESAWMPDSRGDQLMIQAFMASSSVNVEITTARGNHLFDRYALTGFGDAWKTAQAACK